MTEAQELKAKASLPDHLEVTWKENPGGDSVPLVLSGGARVHVEVVDAGGNSVDTPHTLDAWIHCGKRRVRMLPIAQASWRTAFMVRDAMFSRGHFKRCSLDFQVTFPRGDSPEAPPSLSYSVPIILGRAHLVAKLSRYVAGMCVLYLGASVPQLDTVIELVKDNPLIPIAAFLTVSGLTAARGFIWNKLRFPAWALAAALSSLLLVTFFRSKVIVVINDSLEVVTTSDGNQVSPGEHAVTWDVSEFHREKDPAGASRNPAKSNEHWVPCENERPMTVEKTAGVATGSGNETLSCVPFDTPTTFGKQITRLLLLPQVRLGCQPLGLHERYYDLWRKAGSCDLPGGLVVEKQPADIALGKVIDRPLSVEHVTVHYDWEGDQLTIPKMEDYRVLTFKTPQQRFAPTGVRFTLVGNGRLREVEATLHPDEVADADAAESSLLQFPPILTPLPAAQPSVTLEGQVTVGQIPVGRIVAVLASDPEPAGGCWLLPTGERLASLVLRHPSDASSVFHAVAPEFVSTVPVCWASRERPSFGELHLDERWGPSRDWGLLLPEHLIPERISILRGDGTFWGKLECNRDASSATSAGAQGDPVFWEIGPVLNRAPRDELSTLQNSHQRWEASVEFKRSPWFWGCWVRPDVGRTTVGASLLSTNRPEQELERLEGRDRWHLEHRERREYDANQGKKACRLSPDGQERQTGECTQFIEGAAYAKWFKDHGPAQCDPTRSKLCRGPE